jgi:hypothetical protein
MVSITCNGLIVGNSHTTTKAALPKNEFVLECASPNGLPMQSTVCSFGRMAEETAGFQIGEHVLV